MSYKMSDFARIFGMTTEALRYYEQMGLIHPEKTGGRRRQFDTKAFNRLINCKKYRSMGYSVQEVQEQFRHYSYEATLEKMEQCRRQALAESERYARIARGIDVQLQASRAVPEMLGRCRVETSPAAAYLPSQHALEVHVGPEIQQQLRRWLDQMPLTRVAIQFDRHDLLDGREELHHSLGFTLPLDEVQALGLLSKDTLIFPPELSVYTVVSQVSNRFAQNTLRHAMEFLSAQGLTLSGSPWGNVLIAEHCGEEETGVSPYLVEVWLPVARER